MVLVEELNCTLRSMTTLESEINYWYDIVAMVIMFLSLVLTDWPMMLLGMVVSMILWVYITFVLLQYCHSN